MLWIILGAVVVCMVLFIFFLRRSQAADRRVAVKAEPVFTRDEDFGEDIADDELFVEDDCEPLELSAQNAKDVPKTKSKPASPNDKPAETLRDLIAMRIIAEPSRPYSGYELLQALLSIGFRFGQMNIFHRHEEANGTGPVLFSLASATEPGTFDLQSIGNTSCAGLTLFMQFGEQKNLYAAFETMLGAAQQLVSDLGGEIWDDKHRKMDQVSLSRWQSQVKHFEDNRYSYDLFDE